MGVHLVITLEHGLPDVAALSVERIAALFAGLQSNFDHIAESDDGRPSEHPIFGSWRDHTERGATNPRLFGSPRIGYTFTFGPTALSIHTGLKFHRFIVEAAERELHRRFAFDVAKVLNADRMIYGPCEGIGDTIAGAVIDGRSLSQIQALLLGRHGSPAPTIEALASPATRYLIDGVSGSPSA